MWNLHVWNTDFDSVYTVNSNPATVGGLVHAMTYNATVSALCGGGVVESDAYPNEWVAQTKFWIPVGRVDNGFGDRNLVARYE